MRRAGLLLGGLLWLGAVLGTGTGAVAQAAACENITWENIPFSICRAKAGDNLFMALAGADGRPLGSFAALQDSLGNARLVFAMNGGMYHQDRRPVGLYIENGQQVTPASDGGGYGNFGLLPNGIFCIEPDRLKVWESSAFAAARPACRYATQSGPMLVINGRLHPKFLPDSPSRRLRNGVGTSADGSRAVFAISGAPVTFHQFARLFRDRLGLPDALFLDGSVSRLYAPELGRNDAGTAMGPIIALAVPVATDK